MNTVTSPVHLRPATLDDLDTVVALFREYAGGLDIDLSYQDFEDELRQARGSSTRGVGETPAA